MPHEDSFYAALKARAPEIEARYQARSPASGQLAERAQRVLPGGSTRQGVFRTPYPTYITGAAGSELIDADGRVILDFWFDATSLPLGHAHPAVVAAAEAQVRRGTALFSPTVDEIALAELISARLPSAERVLFATSGGEAVMLALRLARAATGRPLIAKFEGSFHGNHDDVLWSVSPAATQVGPAREPAAVPLSAGLLPADGRTLILPYNDIAGTAALLARHRQALAAVIVEPIANRMGLILPAPGFLAALRDECTRHGILVIVDEVMSFRNAYAGMQTAAGIRPDITTLGKIIGGGFPVGAIAGRADLLDWFDPRRANRLYHTGTFAANPVTMVAGRALLQAYDAETVEALNGAGADLRRALARIVGGRPLQITGAGSMFKITATATPLVDYRSTLTADRVWQELASLALLTEGCLLTPHLHGCLATTTTAAQIQHLLDVFARLLDRTAA